MYVRVDINLRLLSRTNQRIGGHNRTSIPAQLTVK